MLTYRIYLEKYGTDALSYALNYFEDREIYEECTKIKKAITNKGDKLPKRKDQNISSRSEEYGEEIIDAYYESISI